MTVRTATALLFCLAAATPVAATIVPIDPFVGALSEDLEDITDVFLIAEQIDVFEGEVTFDSLTDQTTIHLWAGSCLNGDCSIPRSGTWLIGATTAQAILFNTPALQFGAYFTNNSLDDDATATFFDVDGNLLDSLVMDIPGPGTDWYWHGWESDVPIGSIEIHSNGVLEGFIWLDDLELTQIPEPTSLALLVIAGVFLVTPRRFR